MPETPINPTANQPPPTTEAAAAAPKDPAELAKLVAPDYTYPDNDTVPDYLRGKTAKDAAQLLQSLVDAQARGLASASAAPQQPISALGSDDYVTAAHLQQAQQNALAQVSPWLKTVADQQATMSYSLAKSQDAAVFSKYEPEIIQVLQRIPRENWTLDVIKNAATFVKGSHVDELAADKVRALEATMHSTMRSTGRAGLSPDSETKDTVAAMLEKAPAPWLKHARAAGISDEDVHQYCLANEITPQEFFKQMEKGFVTEAVADISFKRPESRQ